ncbi:MAG TPA: PorT family protein [Chitinophagaceae bacterium]|jgi:Outer membrane protein beta-barrel domain|nr:PorT family protein [Chitinophagaceae bacterium]NCW87298.1 PorT family protein [Chitinophagia bacterium]HAL95390.1 PorT family protein [Chitinophagaceae bacterium]
MRVSMLFVLSALLISLQSNGQFHVGVKAGANVTKVDGKSFKDEFKSGYMLGGFAEIKLSKKLYVQPELLINQYNTRLDTNYNNLVGNIFNGMTSVKLDYLSIPILLNYRMGGGFISLQAGPQYGVLIDKNNSILQNTGNAFRNGDLSLLGGVQIKAGAFRINGRYFVGLSNINDITNDSKWKNQGFQLSVGLTFF